MFGVILNNNGVVLATCIAVVVRRDLCSWTPSFFRIRNSLLFPSYSLEQSISLLSVLAILADALQLPKLASLRLFVTIATPIHPRTSLCYYYYNYTGTLFCSTTITTPAGGGWRKKEIGWWWRRRMKLRSFSILISTHAPFVSLGEHRRVAGQMLRHLQQQQPPPLEQRTKNDAVKRYDSFVFFQLKNHPLSIVCVLDFL